MMVLPPRLKRTKVVGARVVARVQRIPWPFIAVSVPGAIGRWDLPVPESPISRRSFRTKHARSTGLRLIVWQSAFIWVITSGSGYHPA